MRMIEKSALVMLFLIASTGKSAASSDSDSDQEYPDMCLNLNVIGSLIEQSISPEERKRMIHDDNLLMANRKASLAEKSVNKKNCKQNKQNCHYISSEGRECLIPKTSNSSYCSMHQCEEFVFIYNGPALAPYGISIDKEQCGLSKSSKQEKCDHHTNPSAEKALLTKNSHPLSYE